MRDRNKRDREGGAGSPPEKRTETFGRARRPPRDTTQSQPITAITEADALGGASVEANIIVIAHPKNKLLGTRYRLVKGSCLEIG
ncbi:MAG: hypothetical protein ACM3L8_04130, partial [Verrucomicrobiota bacterium]